MLKESVTVFNPSVFWNGSILELGLDIIEWGILIVSLIILCVVSVMQYRMEQCEEGTIAESKLKGFANVREFIASKKLALRWAIYIALLFYCILLAEYGPGYSAAEFIYKDF